MEYIATALIKVLSPNTLSRAPPFLPLSNTPFLLFSLLILPFSDQHITICVAQQSTPYLSA